VPIFAPTRGRRW